MGTEKFSQRLAIQSWCFRKYKDAPGVINALKTCKVNNIELCGFHVHPGRHDDWKARMDEYTQAGIVVTCFGVNEFTTDEAAGRKVFELAKYLGLSAISTGFENDAAIGVVEKLCEEYGIKAALHNHGRLNRRRLGTSEALEDLFASTSDNIGLCLDTAWAMDVWDDPIEVAKKFRDRLYGLHIKDFVFDRAGKPEDVVIGTGNLDLDALVKFLAQTDYDGYVTLEFEGDENNPEPATAECVNVFRDVCKKYADL